MENKSTTSVYRHTQQAKHMQSVIDDAGENSECVIAWRKTGETIAAGLTRQQIYKLILQRAKQWDAVCKRARYVRAGRRGAKTRADRKSV